MVSALPGRTVSSAAPARADRGGSLLLWSESQSVQALDNLYDRGIINKVQYLNRLPQSSVPDLTGLIQEIRQQEEHGTAEKRPERLSGDKIKEEF